MRIEAGTVVLVNFPFTDLQSSKVRPAVVLTQKGDDVIIVGIFSKVSAFYLPRVYFPGQIKK